LQFVSNIERWEREVGLANVSEYQQFDKDCSLNHSVKLPPVCLKQKGLNRHSLNGAGRM